MKKILLALARYLNELLDGFEKGAESVFGKMITDIGTMLNETLVKIEDAEKRLGPSKAVPEIFKAIRELQGKVMVELVARGKDLIDEGENVVIRVVNDIIKMIVDWLKKLIEGKPGGDVAGSPIRESKSRQKHINLAWKISIET